MKIHVSLLFGFLMSMSALILTAGADDLNMEQGILTGVGSGWQTVNLLNIYTDPVIVATPQYTESDLPAVTRVRNASSQSFEVRVQNPSDTSLSDYTVQYIVVEAGVYTEAVHGITMEAATVNSAETSLKGYWVGEPGNYSNSYSSPVIFGQVMTENDTEWSVFWSLGSNRKEPASGDEFYVGKHAAQDTNRYRADEIIGYIVMESGSGVINGQTYEVGLGGDSILGMGDSPPFFYDLAPNAWEYAILSQAAMDGDDGSWAVLYGTGSIGDDGLFLSVDEDQIADPERGHTHEQVGYFVSTIPSNTDAQVFSTDVLIGDPNNPANLEVYGTSNLGPVALDVQGGGLGAADNVDYGMAPFWLRHDGFNLGLDGNRLSSDAVPLIIQNTNPGGGIVFRTGGDPTDRLIIDAEGTVRVSSPAGDIPSITY